jgi:hypothetical protein
VIAAIEFFRSPLFFGDESAVGTGQVQNFATEFDQARRRVDDLLVAE